MALSYYNFIPETVYQVTSVTTKKTKDFQTDIGNFTFRHIKPSIYFGYRLIEYHGDRNILLAEPEKALLDYFYLNHQISTIDDFIETRINQDEFTDQIDQNKFNNYLNIFGNKALIKRMEIFMDMMRNA